MRRQFANISRSPHFHHHHATSVAISRETREGVALAFATLSLCVVQRYCFLGCSDFELNDIFKKSAPLSPTREIESNSERADVTPPKYLSPPLLIVR